MSEKKYRWPELREKYRGVNLPDLLVLLELLGLKEGVHLNQVEDLIDRMRAALAEKERELAIDKGMDHIADALVYAKTGDFRRRYNEARMRDILERPGSLLPGKLLPGETCPRCKRTFDSLYVECVSMLRHPEHANPKDRVSYLTHICEPGAGPVRPSGKARHYWGVPLGPREEAPTPPPSGPECPHGRPCTFGDLGDGCKECMARAQETINKATSKRLDAALIECPCGGPPGHVAFGIHCRRSGT